MVEINLMDSLKNVHLFFVGQGAFPGIILIIFGFAECFIGFPIIRYTMTLAGFFVGLFIGSIIPMEWINTTLLRFLISTLLGVGTGAISFLQRPIRIFMKGFLAFILFSAVGSHMAGTPPGNLVLLEIGCLGGIIFVFFNQWTKIVGAALLGSYIFVYGWLITWYSKEALIEMSFVLDIMSLDTRVPGLLFLWTVCFTVGFICQSRITLNEL